MRYLLTIRYTDGMVASSTYSAENLLETMEDRVSDNEKNGNVASWNVEVVE